MHEWNFESVQKKILKHQKKFSLKRIILNTRLLQSRKNVILWPTFVNPFEWTSHSLLVSGLKWDPNFKKSLHKLQSPPGTWLSMPRVPWEKWNSHRNTCWFWIQTKTLLILYKSFCIFFLFFRNKQCFVGFFNMNFLDSNATLWKKWKLQ